MKKIFITVFHIVCNNKSCNEPIACFPLVLLCCLFVYICSFHFVLLLSINLLFGPVAKSPVRFFQIRHTCKFLAWPCKTSNRDQKKSTFYNLEGYPQPCSWMTLYFKQLILSEIFWFLDTSDRALAWCKNSSFCKLRHLKLFH